MLWVIEHTNLVGAAVKYVLKLVKSLNTYDGCGQACQFLLVITCYIDWRVLIIWFEGFRHSSGQCWYDSLNDNVNLQPFCGTLENRPLSYSVESRELFIICIGTQTCWKRPPSQEDFMYVHARKKEGNVKYFSSNKIDTASTRFIQPSITVALSQ